MSKNIVIQEDGLAKNMTVDALRLKKQDGGTEDWVPADGKDLVELQIGGSGTYKASDYNAYGIAVARVKPKYGGGATSKAAEHDFTEKHTPSIKEGGKSRNFSAVMLKTNLQGGGTCLWIPRMDVELKNKYISKSGTYTAKADDCYGFDQVTVSGVDVEIKTDDDGNEYAEITDGGTTTEMPLPELIIVDIPPTFLGPYQVGQVIDYTGMVIKAYMHTGALWTDEGHPSGIIPNNELVLPTVVDSSMGNKWGEASSSFNLSPLPNPISVAGGSFVVSGAYDSAPNHYEYTYTFTPYPGKNVRSFGFHISDNDGQLRSFFASDAGGEIGMLHYYRVRTAPTQQVMDDYTSFISANQSYTAGGKTAFYLFGSNTPIGNRQKDSSVGVPDYFWPINSGPDNGELAWTMIYGQYKDSGFVVPVKWNRPIDNKSLEASFDITTT